MNAHHPLPICCDDAAATAAHVRQLETAFEGWSDADRGAVVAYRQAIEALHGEALCRLVLALKATPGGRAAIARLLGEARVYPHRRPAGLRRGRFAQAVRL